MGATRVLLLTDIIHYLSLYNNIISYMLSIE
jgi:hypothetical protein